MKKIIVILVTVLFVFSCSKYPDGPAFTLLTKKNRLANSWVIAKVIENGVDKTGDYQTALNNYNLIIAKSGTYSSSYSPYGIGTISENGSWSFNGDKTYVIFDPSSNNNGNTSWKILRLKEKELWGYDDDFNGNKVEFHLVQK